VDLKLTIFKKLNLLLTKNNFITKSNNYLLNFSCN